MLFYPELIILQNKWLNQLPALFDLVQDMVFKAKTDPSGLPVRKKLSVLLNKDRHIIDAASACIVFHNLMRHFTI